jgi:VanZ family protein
MSKNKNYFRIIISFLPALIWAALIYYLSDQQVLPGFRLNLGDFLFKKSAHVFVYAILYLLLLLPFQYFSIGKEKYRWLTPLIIAVSYAFFDEFHQSFTPGRNPSLRDVGFDTLGCSLIIFKKLGYI